MYSHAHELTPVKPYSARNTPCKMYVHYNGPFYLHVHRMQTYILRSRLWLLHSMKSASLCYSRLECNRRRPFSDYSIILTYLMLCLIPYLICRRSGLCGKLSLQQKILPLTVSAQEASRFIDEYSRVILLSARVTSCYYSVSQRFVRKPCEVQSIVCACVWL